MTQHEVSGVFAQALITADHETANRIHRKLQSDPERAQPYAREEVLDLLTDLGFRETVEAYRTALEIPF